MRSSDASHENELFQAWRNGDRDALERLLVLALPRVKAYLFNKCSNVADAEDLTVDVLEKALRKAARVQAAQAFMPYIYGIARNVFLDYRARQSRTPVGVAPVELASPTTESPLSHLAKSDEQKLLLNALRSLPLRDQTLVELHFFGLHTHREIAEIMEIPPGSIGGHMQRIRRELEATMRAMEVGEQLVKSTMLGWETWAQGIAEHLEPSLKARNARLSSD
ncbi:MAG: sigma-70 family RNA polymerase sigma factor [Myxococcales bacterium FL481]|nr:MAG: sigma-70 family RNA polymerase sigma factor [Myxococcales bacterium FL481]